MRTLACLLRHLADVEGMDGQLDERVRQAPLAAPVITDARWVGEWLERRAKRGPTGRVEAPTYPVGSIIASVELQRAHFGGFRLLCREAFRVVAPYKGIQGVMGNAQTPFVQLPNIYFFSQLAWNPELSRQSDQAILNRLSALLFPKVSAQIARGWYSLARPSAEESASSARELETLVAQKRLGRPGLVGQCLFPDATWIVSDLSAMLRMHSDALLTVQALSSNRNPDQILSTLVSYFEEALTLQKENGFHPAPDREGKIVHPNFSWLLYGPDYDALRKQWKQFLERDHAAASEITQRVIRSLNTKKFDQALVNRMVDFLLGIRPEQNYD